MPPDIRTPQTDPVARQTFLSEPEGEEEHQLIRVLYVDDEPDLLELGKIFLEQNGEFLVTTITSAPDAIGLIEHGAFDAIISDYQMPVMDGIQFLAEVRSRFGRIPFILFTGKGREEVVIQAINNGVDFYLQKGGDPTSQFAELALKIRQATSRRKAEDLLRKREEDYSHLIGHSDEAIGIIQDGLIRRVNRPITALTGYSEEELLGVPFARFLHPDDVGMVTDRYLKRMSGEQPQSQYPMRLIRKDGSIIWIEVSPVVITWGMRPATINFLKDETARIEAEKAVIREKDYLDQILNTIADPVFVKDEAHRRVLANDAYCRFLGLSREEILDTSDQDLYPPDISESLSWEDDMVLASGTERVREEEICDKNGNHRTLVTKKSLLRDREGKKFIVGIARDITEHKDAEAEVRRTRENYEAFFNSISDLLFVLDTEGSIIYTNETVSRRLGYAKDELAGRPVLMVHPPDQRDEAKRMFRTMLDGNTCFCAVPVMAKDGQVIPVETRVTAGIWDGKPVIFRVSREVSRPCQASNEPEN